MHEPDHTNWVLSRTGAANDRNELYWFPSTLIPPGWQKLSSERCFALDDTDGRV